jgi:hypothetical protein
MPCNRCGAELRPEDIVCLICGARHLRPARVPGGAVNSGPYARRRVSPYAGMRMRAARGGTLAAAIPKPLPLQPASAVAPVRLTPGKSRAGTAPLLSKAERLAAACRLAPNIDGTPAVYPRAAAHEPGPPQASRPAAPPVDPPRPRTVPPDAAPPPRPAAKPVRVREPVRTVAPVRTPVRSAPQPVRRPVRADLHRSEPPSSSAAWIGAMIVSGLALGIGASWWANTIPGQNRNLPVAEATPAVALAEPQMQQPARATPRMPAAPARVAAYRPPVPRTLPAPKPAPVEEAAVEETGSEAEQSAQADESPDMQTAERRPAKAEPSDAGRPPVIERSTPPRTAAAAKPPRKRVATVVRKDRNEEIDRLRTQAFSETRRDRVGRINRPRDGKLPISGRSNEGRINRAFASCDRSGSILAREKCRWRVCGDKWGRDGCPSYQTRNKWPSDPA